MAFSTDNFAPTTGSQNRKIIELRELLAQRFPSAPRPPEPSRLTTKIEALDACLEGGLHQGAITEIVCPAESAGSGTIIQVLVESMQANGKHLALVDAGDSFDSDGLSNTQLSALLWVRCAGPEQAVKAADLLCRDNNLPLVVLDLMMCTEQRVRAIASTYWYRLQRVAETDGATMLVLTPVPVVGSAACKVRLAGRFPLSALDLLRDQLVARLQMDVMRTRNPANFKAGAQALRFWAG